jgi:glycerol-3-phosphate dehydrogenase (NAD(P)+)
MKKVAILGAGSWGSGLALNLASKKIDVTMWTIDSNQEKEINETRENKDYLPGIIFPKNINITTDLQETVQDATMIVSAVPSQAFRSVMKQLKPFLKDEQIVINVAKGLEKNTGLRLSEVFKEEFTDHKFAVLSGPSHAEEVAKYMPTTVVVSSEDLNIAEQVQDMFMTPEFRVYINCDIIGVELGGALKNVIAFGAGICDGLGFGDNSKAALITRGISEISKLGVALGAEMSTFSGLSGIGDLIVTCTSMHSRNRRAGILVGQGKTIQEAQDEVKMVVEGVTATIVAHELANRLGVEVPIIDGIYSIIEYGKNAKEISTNLMIRQKKHEIEKLWI